MIPVTTERMILFPLSCEKLRAKMEEEPDAGMKQAYSEMLTGCIQNPGQQLWYTLWVMQLKDGGRPFVGSLCFKGLDKTGTVEIGYGIEPGYGGKGLTTEAVTAMAKWADVQPGVLHIEAETEPENAASQAVLQKSGFVPNGVLGEEGPRFEWRPV